VQLHDVRTFKELETYHGHQKEVTGFTYFLPCLFSPTTMFWDLKFATPVQLDKCRSAMEEIKLRKNYHCLFHVYWCTKLCTLFTTQHWPGTHIMRSCLSVEALMAAWFTGWLGNDDTPSSHLSEASCCFIWKRHRYGHLWFRALVLFLQWGHQAVRKLGFH
jgi:hypothetical protein